MAREEQVAQLLQEDSTLMGILTGGIYARGTVGQNGITRETAPNAFDSHGWLKPCALVKQRGLIPTADVLDYDAKVMSATQVVEVWFYQDTGYDWIDAAMARVYALLQGYRFSDTFELTLSNVIDRERDRGALDGASLARQDWAVYSILGG